MTPDRRARPLRPHFGQIPGRPQTHKAAQAECGMGQSGEPAARSTRPLHESGRCCARRADRARHVALGSMFWSAHFVVKFVMLGLLAASVWCWADHHRQDAAVLAHASAHGPLRGGVLVGPVARGALPIAVRARRPTSTGRRLRRRHARMEALLRGRRAAPFAEPAAAHRQGARRHHPARGRAARIAPPASWPPSVRPAPFIGLFGTVWGIMTSFRSIAASKNTSLAVVAPGIAEALFATAIGLFAAIPAVIAYNKLQAEVAKLQARLEGFADEFSRHPVAPDRRAHRGLTRLRESWPWPCIGRSAGTAARAAAGARRRGGAINEINMTPFIDVMLVLLIIFMVAAPLMTAGVPLDLPQTKARAAQHRQEAAHPVDQGDGPGLPGGGRADGSTRSCRKLHGDRRRRARRAHLCARRQGGRLRPRRPGDVDRDRRPATSRSRS